ncbi:MAG: VOC family protein [Cetobacterium sp.]|nr:VOC family protein [Cetobacterium sp.]
MRIHHICIETSSYKESLEFYIKVLKFSLVKETKNFHGRDYNSWLENNGFYIELQTPKKNLILNKNENRVGIVHVCFFVENIENELERIKLIYKNFKLKDNEIIYNVGGGKLFKIISPEGSIIEIRNNPSF